MHFSSTVQGLRKYLPGSSFGADRGSNSAPNDTEKRAAIFVWIGTALFTIGAMFFGH